MHAMKGNAVGQRAAVRGKCAFTRQHASIVCAATPKLKLIYFEAPARGEATRLMLTLAKVPFEDYRFPREQWPELKPKMPFGQVPVLEVDGKLLAQQTAIERYVAKLTGMYPSDPFTAAQVDQYVSFMAEFLEVFAPTFSIKDKAEQVAARKAVVDGPLAAKMKKLNDILAASPSGYLVGDSMTWADVNTYCALSLITCGFLEGVPTRELFEQYPAVKAFHQRVATTPGIKECYKDITEGQRLAYKAA